MTLNSSLIQDINPGVADSLPGFAPEFTNLFGQVYFHGDNGTNGFEVLRYNPNAGEGVAPVTLVTDINPAAANSNPRDLTVLNGQLYFSATEPTNGNELYTYDPETGVTTRLSDINPAANDSSPQNFEVLDGQLYFAATDDGTTGTELYTYDPETGAITRLSDINPAAGDSFPSDLTAFNGLLYFAAIDDGTTGNELYTYDPETGAITRLSDINPAAGNSNPREFTVLNGQLYFRADDGTTGTELYRYDPETGAITRLSDINPAAGNSDPANLTVFDGQLYFSATDAAVPGTDAGNELYRYNPEDGSITLVADINVTPGAGDTSDSGLGFDRSFTVFQGELYFLADNGVNGLEVYKYSPDTDEATLVTDINQLPADSTFPGLTAFQGELLVSADDGTATTGRELYSLTPDPIDGRVSSAERAPIGEDGDNFTPVNGGWTSQGQFPRTLADVNGDGWADIIGFGQTSVFVSLSEGDGSFGEAVNVLDAFTPDNGGWNSQDRYPRTAADVNGDGRADLVGFGADSVFVSLYQEDGTFGEVQAVDVGGEGLSNFTVNSGGWTSQNKLPRMFGDFNGDGRDDIIGFGNTDVFVSLSEFDGETVSFGEVTSVLESLTPVNGGWNSQDRYPRMVGDFDGDGRDDIIGFGANDVFISFSNGDGTFTNAEAADIGEDGSSNFTVNNGGWTSQDQFPRMVADIDGDTLDDIIGFGQNEIFFALSEGDGSFTEAEILTLDGVNNFTAGSGGWTSQDLLPRFLDDINGDDKADIVGFGSQSVFATLA